ncbi:MAG: hypothetical protein RIB58_12295 [Phycisphaerales bacterium]
MRAEDSAIAVILARAGSQGLPGKNHAPIAGRPCVSWTIDHTLAAQRVGRAGVSTDDDAVAAVAIEAGIEHWPREPSLATATARVDDAARAALRQADERTAVAEDAAVVLLYANVPVRPTGLIDRAVTLLIETGCDSVQSYASVGKFHPAWTSRVDDGGRVRPWEGERLFGGIYRRQDLEPAFVPDGGVLVVRRACLDATQGNPHPHAFLGDDHRGITTETGDVVDIDNALDLAVADQLLRQAAAGQAGL